MKPKETTRIVIVALVAVGWGTVAHGADRMVGVSPADGSVMLVKRFEVPAGTLVMGMEYSNNDPDTTFPEVRLIRGPLSTLSEGTLLANASSVTEASPGVGGALWTVAVHVLEDSELYLAIRFPSGEKKRGPGVGPAIGSFDVSQPNGSYVASDPHARLVGIRADLDLRLLTGGASKANRKHIEPGGKRTTSLPTWLGVASPVRSGAMTTVWFHAEKDVPATLTVYNVAGRMVRRLRDDITRAGANQCTWDGNDDVGVPVPAGIYFVRLNIAQERITRKLVVTQ